MKKYTCGVTSGIRVLYTREDDSLPPDLRCHSLNGTTTWYSNAEGDRGGLEYLRRYGDGSYAIHLLTWCTKKNIESAIENYRSSHDDKWLALHEAAILELDRRIISTERTKW